MGNIINPPSFFPNRLSQYVPSMQFASDVNMQGDTRVSLGSPSATNNASYLSAQSVSAAGVATSFLNSGIADAPYGRSLQLVLSGSGTPVITIVGTDYLGQQMLESLILSASTPVNGKKAFKRIISVTWPTVGAVTMNVGWGANQGLPYACYKVISEEVNGVPGTVGTAVPGALVQTAFSNDPRGTYVPNSTPDGVKVLTVSCLFMADVDTNNVGGLHGAPHYAG